MAASLSQLAGEEPPAFPPRTDEEQESGLVRRPSFPSSPPSTAPTFSGGLLPSSAQADTYDDASKRWETKVFGQNVEAGVLYVKFPGGLELGLDLNARELVEWKFWRAVVAEFCGTLLFLFFIVTTVVYRTFGAGKAIKPSVESNPDTLALINFVGTTGAATQLLIAASFGTMITILVYAIAPISGGHLNPAISFGLALTKKVTVLRLVFYVMAQVGGAILGTLIASHLNWAAFKAAGGAVNGSLLFSARELLVAEIMATALLVFVVYAATDPLRAKTVIHIGALGPLAIGGAIFAAHLALIPLDGTGINPARSLGPAIVYGSYRQHWIFWVGPLIGAALAACFYEIFLKETAEVVTEKEQ